MISTCYGSLFVYIAVRSPEVYGLILSHYYPISSIGYWAFIHHIVLLKKTLFISNQWKYNNISRWLKTRLKSGDENVNKKQMDVLSLAANPIYFAQFYIGRGFIIWVVTLNSDEWHCLQERNLTEMKLIFL